MWKNMVEEGKSKTTKTGMRFACRITKARKNTLNILNTYCFSPATKVTRTHLEYDVTGTLPVMSDALVALSLTD